jgi:ribonuclease BN (tRNA processing enzyme)
VGVKLTIVGSAPAWARTPGRASSCYLIESPDDAIVLDLGQGALAALHGIREPSSLRAVLVSHLHTDHHVDLVPLRHLLRYGYAEPRHVELHAPPGLRARYDDFLGEPGFLDGLPGPDLSAGVRILGTLAVEIQPVTHAEPSFAFRVSAGASPGSPGIVYSGDCGQWRDLLHLIRPGDTLLSEAFWGTMDPDPAAHHLTAAEAAAAAREGEAARLLMTHIEQHHDPDGAVAVASELFEGEVALATPGLVVDVGPGSAG